MRWQSNPLKHARHFFQIGCNFDARAGFINVEQPKGDPAPESEIMKTKIFGFSTGAAASITIGILFAADYIQGRQTTSPDQTTIELAAGEVTPPDTTVAGAPTLPPAPPSVSATLPQLNTTNQFVPSPAQPGLPGVALSKGAADIARLAQSGIGEDVMLAYIANVNLKFNLGTDQIVYLNDIGVSGNVVKTMIQHDASIDTAAQAYAASVAAANQPVPPAPAPDSMPDSTYPAPPMEDTSAQLPPYDPGSYVPSDDAEYFYPSLAPYGSWTYLAGVGLCWQPTVFVVNHEWRPYCDRGRWLYSDCGWYWQSDYTWGWAAFHYGRWLNDAHRGWVWCPDRVWSPAWVSWRRSGEFCGWAPLPPSARFVPGTGFVFGNHKVDAGFEFGLHARQYTFIPIERLSDYTPSRYAVASWRAEELHNQTKVITEMKEQNHRVVSRGVDPKEVAALGHTEIRQAEVRVAAPGSLKAWPTERVGRSGGSVVIYRPELPTPTHRAMPGGTAPVAPVQPVPAGRTFGGQRTSENSATPKTVQTASLGNNSSQEMAELKTRIATAQQSAAAHVQGGAQAYPPGSLVVHGSSTISAPTPPAPLPNMNLSYLAHQPVANPASASTSVTSTEGWQTHSIATPHSDYRVENGFARPANASRLSWEEAPARPEAPVRLQTPHVISGHYSVSQQISARSPQTYLVATPANQEPSRIEQMRQEAASQTLPGRFTAAQQLNARSPQTYFGPTSASESRIEQLRQQAASQRENSGTASGFASHSHAEHNFESAGNQFHSESHSSYSAPAHESHSSYSAPSHESYSAPAQHNSAPAQSTSSSTSSSSGKK